MPRITYNALELGRIRRADRVIVTLRDGGQSRSQEFVPDASTALEVLLATVQRTVATWQRGPHTGRALIALGTPAGEQVSMPSDHVPPEVLSRHLATS